MPSVPLTAHDIAALVNGHLTGNPAEVVVGVAGIREAQPGEVAFVANPKYLGALDTTRATVILVGADCPDRPGLNLIRVENPSLAFTKVVEKLCPPPITYPPGIHPAAVAAPTVQLGRDVSIQPHAVIEDGAVIGDRAVIGAGSYIGHESQIGTDCLIYPRVTIRERTRVGQRVILHSGVVLGADGFGFENIRGERQKIPQVGTVEIGDDVEIGANSCVDRGRFGKTRIGRGTKIDNLVQIGHNVVIGEHGVICGGVGIAGSAVVGNYVTIAGQVGVAGHLTIGDKAIIGAQAGVTKDVAAGEIVFGAPAQPHMQFKRVQAAQQRLPASLIKLRALEREVTALREQK